MTTLSVPVEQHFLLSGIDWGTYVAFGDLLGEQPVRLTYDRGSLELMTLSHEHEWYKSFMGRLLEVVTEEMDIDLASGGSTTFRREDLERGLEPDECFWIEHESLVRGKEQIDLTIDPPPDLVVEVEMSRSVLDRLAIYAALDVPEVWRFDGQAIHVLCLGPDGRYAERSSSKTFPFLPVTELARFLGMRATMSETKLAQAFRVWVRERIAAGWR